MTDTPIYGRPIQGEFRIGHVFSRAWEIFTANFFPLVLIASIPPLLNVLLPRLLPTSAVIASICTLLGFVANFVVQAMILFVAFQYLRGQPAPLGEAVQKGLGRFLPILGLSIVLVVGVGIGFLLLIIPGVILMVMWSVALPACVVERLGPITSLRRSAALTKGHRWSIFGLFLLLWLLAMVVLLLLGALVGVAIGSAGPSPSTVTLAVGIFAFVATALVTAYYNSILVMVYHDLRVAKDGLDVDQIAAVFD